MSDSTDRVARISGLMKRPGRLETRAADGRVIEAVVSTETPVNRFFGSEILSHEEGAIDLSRVDGERGLPFIRVHDR